MHRLCRPYRYVASKVTVLKPKTTHTLRAWKSGPDHLPSVTRHPPKPPYKIDSLLEQHIHLTHLTHRARTELQIRLSPQHSNY
jgi:hypothetical protein